MGKETEQTLSGLKGPCKTSGDFHLVISCLSQGQLCPEEAGPEDSHCGWDQVKEIGREPQDLRGAVQGSGLSETPETCRARRKSPARAQQQRWQAPSTKTQITIISN